MEKLKETQEEILTVIDEEKKDKEDFKRDLEEFISCWEKEAEDLKNRELTDSDSGIIYRNFELSKAKLEIFLDCYLHLGSVSQSDYRKIDLIESKINNSLAIARSNYHRKHRTVWERLADNFGIKLHIFGRGH